MNAVDAGMMVRQRRRLLGISQQDLAAISGVSLHTLSNLETGVGNPALETLTAVLEPLGLELLIRPRTPA